MSDNPSNNGEIMVKRDEQGRILPGSVLNPAGKPPGTKHMSTLVNEILFEKVPTDEKGRTYREMLIKSMLTKAIQKADASLINIIFDRVEGKPDQGINMNMSGEIKQTAEHVMEIAKRVSEELKKEKTE